MIASAHFYAHENSNIHRAAHELAARATDAYEGARETRAPVSSMRLVSVEEIIFVRGTTEAINLVAKSWGAQNMGDAGDEIIVSAIWSITPTSCPGSSWLLRLARRSV